MAVIEWEKNESVAVVTMTNGANRQNLVFADRMNQVFDEILADPGVHAVILTSGDEKNFSQGVDVAWLGERFNQADTSSIKAFMYGMNKVFSRILLMPVPVIAAINGHAFGNGAMLACACDFRFMKKDRGFFCFPEVDINIPFLPGMIGFVRKAMPEYLFNDLKLTGRRVTADELEKHHVLVKANSDKESMDADALAFARTFHKGRTIFGEHKKRLHKSIVQTMETEDPVFIDALNLFVA
ncbi:MAG: enoyl-CoA hydratase/isomerase family protein [Pseudomonadota bacterium]